MSSSLAVNAVSVGTTGRKIPFLSFLIKWKMEAMKAMGNLWQVSGKPYEDGVTGLMGRKDFLKLPFLFLAPPPSCSVTLVFPLKMCQISTD